MNFLRACAILCMIGSPVMGYQWVRDTDGAPRCVFTAQDTTTEIETVLSSARRLSPDHKIFYYVPMVHLLNLSSSLISQFDILPTSDASLKILYFRHKIISKL